MQYCKKCLYPENHPLNITFDSEGICSGCRVHEEKDTLDWDEREKKLVKLLNRYKGKSLNYDCIIPITGGKDSYFIVDLIINKYGLKPLLVSYNKQYNTLTGIRNIQYLKSIFGADCIESTIDPNFAKLLVKHTLSKIGSIYWHNHLGSTTFPVQIATRFKVPLIIWGVHQGIDQVGMYSHTDEVEMTRKYRKEHDLMGYEAEDMISEKDGITEQKMKKFFYPTDKEIQNVGVRGIYLGNYIRWDSKVQHENMIKKYSYETLSQTRTFNNYDNVDCHLYSDIHDYIKLNKFGYGKVTDHVSREIRLGKITRDEGLKLVLKYKNIKPRYLDDFLKWANLSESFFNNCILLHTNKKLSNTLINKSVAITDNSSIKFMENIKNKEERSDFILMAKGWLRKSKC
jgi:N-acetyl sugar amidotransferase